MSNRKRLGDLLVSIGLITSEELAEAMEIQKYRHQPLGQLLVHQGFITKERLLLAIDNAYNIADENDSEEEDILVAPPDATMDRLVTEALGQITLGSSDEDFTEGSITEAETRPVVGLVNQVIANAIRMRASDIHIEPRQGQVEVRYRLDGHLQRIRDIPKQLQAAVIARIKVVSRLDIVEYRIPQDGRCSVTVDGKTIDLRVSVLPTYHGQRVVLRVLDKSNAQRTLPELGFSPENLVTFLDFLKRPYGLILVTGPTGSGKTTTLYAALNQLKDVATNIMTCEDPVEYDLDGINQSHVNEKVGLTFAAQLRAILRQDPDIVLVGEIRDRETAETAIRAAMTGHLVLSTLHTNDAPSAVPRLMDMGIDPFLLSTTLIGILAQRLVRLLCPHCMQRRSPTPEEVDLLSGVVQGGVVPLLGQSAGCPECMNTGYRGRQAVHEIFPVVADVQHAIARGESLDILRQLGTRVGYRPMYYDAGKRVVAGHTTLAEARKLVLFDSSLAGSPAPAVKPAA